MVQVCRRETSSSTQVIRFPAPDPTALSIGLSPERILAGQSLRSHDLFLGTPRAELWREAVRAPVALRRMRRLHRKLVRSPSARASNKDPDPLKTLDLHLRVPHTHDSFEIACRHSPAHISAPPGGFWLVELRQERNANKALALSALEVRYADASGREVPFSLNNPASALRPCSGILGGWRTWFADRVATLEVDRFTVDRAGVGRVVGRVKTIGGLGDRAIDETDRNGGKPGGASRALVAGILEMLASVSGRAHDLPGTSRIQVDSARISLDFPDGPMEIEATGKISIRVLDPAQRRLAPKHR